MKNDIIKIKQAVTDELYIKSGINKQNEIARLIYEIIKKYRLTLKDFYQLPDIENYIKKRKSNFHIIKDLLLKIRYPISYSTGDITKGDIYLPKFEQNKIKNKYSFSGKFMPKKIYIEKDALSYKLAEKILNKFGDIKPIIINRLSEFKRNWREYIGTIGKDELFLVKENNDILKPCPCTKNVVSCGYYIFNLGFGCPYDCSYCYLQHYTNFPGIIMPVNIEEILKKLKILLKQARIPMLRIGTGEFTDSLAIDDVTGYTEYIIPFFQKSEFILELKTKSINIENVLKFKGGKNVVIAWSLNPQRIIEDEEHFTPSLYDRLKAAKKVISNGFKVAFHFDPIIYYNGWQTEYKEVIDTLFEYAGGKIAWISLGTLRFHRTLKPIIEQRFPDNTILDGELLINPIDKKMRYPNSIRVEIYKNMVNWIRSYDKKVNIYFCMENSETWSTVNLKLKKFSV